ncbi:leucine-rich repeat-containing protein [Tanacetum coccineum]
MCLQEITMLLVEFQAIFLNGFHYRKKFFLDLSRNNFSGELPENLGNANRLSWLLLSENNISGKLPASISKIDGLELLNLSKNRLFGDSLPVFGDKSFFRLDLSDNNFSGKIPTNFPKGTQVLFLGGNKFSGNLPWNLTKLVNLRFLDLQNNNIIGNMQDILPQIPSLEILILRNNSFKGFLPTNISNLSRLRILDLSSNSITGSIPQVMTKLPKMIETKVMSTSSVEDSHSIEYSSGNTLAELQDLIVNWKKSFRGLPVGNLDMYSLLDLSANRISGDIPPSIGNLKALKVLNISHNMISGHIPVSIGSLEVIESLDLSHNKISGSIPQSIVQLHELTTLDMSNNRLTGRIPIGGQMDTMTGFQDNSGLCGMQIKVICPEDIIPSERRDEDLSQIFWQGTWIGFPVGFFISILIMGYFLNFLQLFKIW